MTAEDLQDGVYVPEGHQEEINPSKFKPNYKLCTVTGKYTQRMRLLFGIKLFSNGDDSISENVTVPENVTSNRKITQLFMFYVSKQTKACA